MYDFIKGQVVKSSATQVVLESGEIGYEITTPMSTSSKVKPGQQVTIFTHLYVREDQMRLFGFFTEIERLLFRKLIAISGIGPVAATSILSFISVEEFIKAIKNENLSQLKMIKGIGPKTAGRLILEMKSPAGALEELLLQASGSAALELGEAEEAKLALVQLGFQRAVAEVAVKKAAELLGEGSSTEDLVRQALKHT